MHPMLETAVSAAEAAGNVIREAALDVTKLAVEAKRLNDFVSEVDYAAEAAILRILREAYPDHGVVAEESGPSSLTAEVTPEYRWFVDPLDGTTNFLHGIPQYAVSIALAHHGALEQAVVYDPVKQEQFTASRGQGAFLNGKRIHVSVGRVLNECLIGTGIPFRNESALDPYLAMLRNLTHTTAGIRRAGSAALDLAYVACGRFDGFWEMGLYAWDMAAGALLITEAGGQVGDLQGEPGYLDRGDIIAGNTLVFPHLVRLSKSVATQQRREPD